MQSLRAKATNEYLLFLWSSQPWVLRFAEFCFMVILIYCKFKSLFCSERDLIMPFRNGYASPGMVPYLDTEC